MKNIIITAALFVASFFAFSPASAQLRSSVKVEIPFSFAFGDARIPAGTYIIVSDAASPFVKLQSVDGTVNISSLAYPDSPSGASTSALIFHHYGDQYFLHRISRQGSLANLRFTPGKAEKRAKTRDELAGIPPSDPVLVALN